MLKWLPSTWKSCFPQISACCQAGKRFVKFTQTIHQLVLPAEFCFSFFLSFFYWVSNSSRLAQTGFVVLFYWSTSPELWNKHTPSWDEQLESMENYLTARFNFINRLIVQTDSICIEFTRVRTEGGWRIMDVTACVGEVAEWHRYMELQQPSPLVERKGCRDAWGRVSEHLVLNFTSWMVIGWIRSAWIHSLRWE